MKHKNIIISTLGSTLLTVVIMSFFGFNSNSVRESKQNNDQIGTIKIWPGNPSRIPAGWRICDGSDLLKANYSVLYERIGTYWDKDEGYNADFFRIPDLRGVFLRGVNGDRNDVFSDPNSKERSRMYSSGSISKEAVGSFQTDALKNHTHKLKVGSGNATLTVFQDGLASVPQRNNVASRDGYSVSSGGKEESRPKNAYVHFIIKVE